MLTIVTLAIVLLISLFVNHGFKKILFSRALLWISSVAMIGVLGEITVDTIYNYFFHTPLWHYNFLPVHHAYTSGYAPILWGSFGFYLYLLHHKYEKWSHRQLVNLSLIFALEALILEATEDLLSKAILGKYIYYYHPGGLWHISAFQNFPFYFICGALIILTIHWFKSSPNYFIFLSTWVTVVTIYFK